MKKKKVMHVLCMNTYSGAENVAITLIDSVKSEFNSVYVSPDGPIKEVVCQNGIKHYAVPKVNIKYIKKAIRVIKPDIIHAHDFTAGIVCAISGGSIPVVNHLHNNSPWLQRYCIKSFVYGITCLRYKRILTVSDSVMKEYILGSCFKKKSIVIGNPINITKVQECANNVENHKEIPEYDIAFLGRLTPQKNIFFFLEIIQEIAKEVPNLKVSVIGDGELREEVERRIEELGLVHVIRLYGFQKNPYIYLKQAKVMCMPSKWEGFGLAAVEALALGKPVIAAPVGGLNDIINDNCGKLCITKKEYVDEIKRSLTDQDYLKMKSLGALKRAMEYDNIIEYSKKITDIYNSI